VTEDNRPTDLELVGRDVAEASRALSNATQDVEDIERDAAGWPDAGDVPGLASDARSALEALSDALDRVFEATDPKETR
jgi:hypothetical protein